MRIFCLISPIYDYLTATLIEGLTSLGHELWCSEDSNYGRKIPDSQLHAYAESADLILVGSNGGVRTHLLQDLQNPKIVFLDGSDQQAFAVTSHTRYKAVFKRELSVLDTAAPGDSIYPLPFAAEKRYFTNPNIEKDILVSFVANMATNPLRASIHSRLQAKGSSLIVSGSTNERAYDPAAPGGMPIETPAYRSILARSFISVSVPGAGYDCARFWEIPAAGALLFTYKPDIVIPWGFQDGVDCVTFGSLDEFNDKLEYYTSHLEVAGKLAIQGYQHLLNHHTTAHRAAYFLERAKMAVKQPGYCSRFLHPEIQALEHICVGHGIDVGCGSNKTTPGCIGVDLTPKGSAGRNGSEAGQISVAEVCSAGDSLAEFADDSLDYVVARHNLEHYQSPEKTLREWKRVVRPGGQIGIVVPDHTKVNTYQLDPTHYSHFTMDSFSDMTAQLGGLAIEQMNVCVPNWSFVAVMRKVAGESRTAE